MALVPDPHQFLLIFLYISWTFSLLIYIFFFFFFSRNIFDICEIAAKWIITILAYDIHFFNFQQLLVPRNSNQSWYWTINCKSLDLRVQSMTLMHAFFFYFGWLSMKKIFKKLSNAYLTGMHIIAGFICQPQAFFKKVMLMTCQLDIWNKNNHDNNKHIFAYDAIIFSILPYFCYDKVLC